MRINRERFILIAGLVCAAAACTASATNNPSGDGGAPGADAGNGGNDSGKVTASHDAGQDAGGIFTQDADLFAGWDGGCLGTATGSTALCAPFEVVVPEGGAPIEDSGGEPPCITFDLCESIS